MIIWRRKLLAWSHVLRLLLSLHTWHGRLLLWLAMSRVLPAAPSSRRSRWDVRGRLGPVIAVQCTRIGPLLLGHTSVLGHCRRPLCAWSKHLL